MSSRPPREGARWGGDPAPEPEVQRIPDGYQELCERYGEVNVQRAVALQKNLKDEYPMVASIKAEPMQFSAGVLSLANALMKNATEDGRSHTMSETFKALEKQLGGNLARYPDAASFADIPTFNLSYGDEDRGTRAKELREQQGEAQRAAERQAVLADNIFGILGIMLPVAIVVGAYLFKGADAAGTAFVATFAARNLENHGRPSGRRSG